MKLKNKIPEDKKRAAKKSSSEINLLYKTGQKLSATLNVHALFNTMFESLSKIMDCDELFISTFNPRTNLIKCEYIRSKDEKNINVSSIPLIPLAPKGYGIQSRAIRSKKAIIINDYERDFKKVITSHNIIIRTGRKPDNQDIQYDNPRSVLVIPMKLKNIVTGVVQIFSRRENAYEKGHLKFAESMVHLLVLAYNNVLLIKNARKEINERISTENKLRQLLKEKEILVREVHHRVKNNLQAISTLLKLQTGNVHDPEAIQFLDQSRDQVKAISIIHDKLYRDTDINSINFEQYTSSLIEQLYFVYGISRERIETDLQIYITILNVDTAIPCGLIINELVSNSFKHAFPDDMCGKITVKLNTDKKRKYILKYYDNGIGLANEINSLSMQSLGMQLINMLTEQLHGEMKIENKEGFKFQLKFTSM
ncbi:MAG: hypothetical protein EHM58_06425 [Ignavibacteriae bacterium]|nr:MAG: hypothetical protein EHM58_06425 [Ignavibacteriota bacterium]